MKKTLTAITFFISSYSYSQKWWKPTKNEMIGYSFMLVSGVSKAFNQAVLFHHYGQGNSFWDKDISWMNKYKDWPTDQSEAYFLSKSLLAFTTDGQHLTYAINTAFLTTGTVFICWNFKDELKNIQRKDRWKYIVFKKILLPALVRSVAFEITFNNL